EVFRIYNDWLKEFCSHYPDRHIGLACLPYGDIEAAVQEVHRTAKMGLRGLELSCSWDMEPMWHPAWEPLWQAVAAVDLPLHFRTFPTTAPRARTEAPQVQRAAMFTGVSAFQMGLIHIMAGMMGAGVFERHPNLRIGFGESGVGWIPYALHRMDFEFEDRFRDLMKLKPSEYWRRQCRATFQDRKSTRLNSSHVSISYAVFCLKKKNLCLFFFRLRFLLLVFLLRFFDQAHIRNVNRPFTFRNLAARVILRLPQVLLNNTHPFNQHPLLLRQHLQNFAARTAEIPRDHFDVVALFYVKLDPVHKVNVAQSSSLWGLQASRLRDFHSQDGCATKNSSFITTPPAPARRSS